MKIQFIGQITKCLEMKLDYQFMYPSMPANVTQSFLPPLSFLYFSFFLMFGCFVVLFNFLWIFHMKNVNKKLGIYRVRGKG